MKKKLGIIFIIVFCQAEFLFANDCNDSKIKLLCKNHPEKIEILFSSLNLDYLGFEKVKSAWQKKDCLKACNELLQYYNTVYSTHWVRKKTVGRDAEIVSVSEQLNIDDILKDTFTYQEVKATVTRKENGGLDWNYMPGDDNNNLQWTLFLNRHFHLETLKKAYFASGGKKYIDRINADLRDWILSSPYEHKGLSHSDTSNKKWQWSLLETASRATIWPDVFYGLFEHLDPDVKILMLFSMSEHADCLRNFHAPGGNHLAMEMRGLTKLTASFPEYKESEKWLEYAIGKMSNEFDKQVYPDGVQKELTVHYHAVAYRAFYAFVEILDEINRPLPQNFKDKLIQMIDYMAYVQRPSGHGPLNNDSDLIFLRNTVAKANEKFHRGGWSYIVSNGREGKMPEKLSIFYPWAGQLIMRSGWDTKAQWAFFDIGPCGTGHRHFDKLHLSVSAYGRDLLVDSGRYTYTGYSDGTNSWRNFFVGSDSHNVLLVDGKGQNRERYEAEKPLLNACIIKPEYDFARGTFTRGFHDVNDKIEYTRAVTYLRGNFWLVVDRLTCKEPHQVQALWHWHPECTVKLDGQSAASADKGKANLRIIPVSPFDWKVQLVKGQEKPFIQGWYSVEYNKKTPNTVAVYTADMKKTQTFAWLLLVDPNNTPKTLNAKIVNETEKDMQIMVEIPDNKKITFFVPMTGSVEAFSIK